MEMTIKFVLFVSCIIAIQAEDNNNKELQKIISECGTESNFDPSKTSSKENSKEFKCFLKCITIKVNQMDEEGNINLEKTKEVLGITKDNIEGIKAVKQCINDHKEEDLCERVFELRNCFAKSFGLDIDELKS